MPNAIRIILMGTCAAIGVAVAIALALTQADASPSSEALRAEVSAQPTPAPPQSSDGNTPAANSAATLQQPPATHIATAAPSHAVSQPVAANADSGNPWSDVPSAGPRAGSPLSPEFATYRRQVSGQIDELQDSIELLDRNSQKQQRYLNDILSSVQDAMEQRAAPPALVPPPPAPVPPAPLPPAIPALPETASPHTEEPESLPKPRAPRITHSRGDDHLSINVQNTDIREVLELLSQQGGLNILASKSVSGAVTASLTGVDLETALAAILKSTGYVARREGQIIYVGTPADFAAMDQTEDRILTRVYRPNYIKAADLQGLFTSLLTPEVGKVTVSAPADVDIPADQIKTGGNNLAGTDVVIVRDYDAVLKQLDQIFLDVDVKPQQVSIEAMILSVKLSDTYKMGVNFEALKANNNVRLISGSPLASLGAIDVSEGGLKFGYLDGNLSLFIDALETIGDTNVIASPRLMCLNKQRAEIQIGEQLGYVSTTVTESSSTQTVNFLDVGTLLRMRPFISNDGLIRMEVHPELSTGTVEVQQGMTLPNKSVTQVTTNVMCTDGCTVVIGGLIREDLQTITSQIPYLGSLPLLGPAFRQKTENIDRTELIVLITPRIVSEPIMCQEGKKYGNEFTQRQSVYFDKMSPIGRRNYGNHWLRKARASYNAQDYDVAMRQVNLAIHFDPLNRDAIGLRNDVVAAGGFEDESIHEYLKRGLYPWQRPVGDYSRDGYPWKDADAFSEQPEWQAIEDPGQPGPVKTIAQPRPEIVIPDPLEQATTLP
jgi:type IV pilus assembly protein PilQ